MARSNDCSVMTIEPWPYEPDQPVRLIKEISGSNELYRLTNDVGDRWFVELPSGKPIVFEGLSISDSHVYFLCSDDWLVILNSKRQYCLCPTGRLQDLTNYDEGALILFSSALIFLSDGRVYSHFLSYGIEGRPVFDSGAIKYRNGTLLEITTVKLDSSTELKWRELN